MDLFRQLQKQECKNAGKSKHKYGCPCCRKIKTLSLFKRWSRKLAKSRLKQKDQKDKETSTKHTSTWTPAPAMKDQK